MTMLNFSQRRDCLSHKKLINDRAFGPGLAHWSCPFCPSMLLSRYATLIKKGLFNNYKQFFIRGREKKAFLTREKILLGQQQWKGKNFFSSSVQKVLSFFHRKHQQYPACCCLLTVFVLRFMMFSIWAQK